VAAIALKIASGAGIDAQPLPNRIRVFRGAAYQTHVQTPHFRCRAATDAMVMARKLMDVTPLSPATAWRAPMS
jgi:hypothetical protein